MKSYLWFIAFTISLVQVKSQTAEDHAPQSYVNTQLPFSTGYSGLSRRQYGSLEPLQSQGFNSGFLSNQQIGLPFIYQTAAPYLQSSLDYQQHPQAFQPFQFPLLKSFQSGNNGPIGGRSASRAHRLQYLYTKAVPSKATPFDDKQQDTFLPFSINTAFAPVAVTPTVSSTYPTSTPKTFSFPQISSTISSVPSVPSIPSAPPLPTVPSSVSQIKVSYPKQTHSTDGSYSLTSSIPIAEGHSVGNGIAYTFNTGLDNVLRSQSASQPFAFPPFTGFTAQPHVFSGHSALGTSLGSNTFNFPNSFHDNSALHDFNTIPYSFGTTGYDNSFGALSNFGANYGDHFASMFNAIFKRDSKLKISPLKKESKVATKSHN